ncbi:nucleolar complex protein-like protein 3 [Aulographum hederae CBS 113979]|uniref:Nucleolar complex-associated protein 3 n=1 Tax=Aulographum hederae CBS 113979 TaxID=1176131 RepID=A0A6G1GQM0_9PEZI|nr:nucleolar complex protein-like protein 3 [Aulographum hederae CBS 113979]
MSHDRTTKRRRLSTPEQRTGNQKHTADETAFFQRAAQWNLEQDYENRPRKLDKKTAKRTKLPIKTAEGWVEQELSEASENEADSFLASGDEERGIDPAEVIAEAPKISAKEEIIQAKEELARIAGHMNEDPEEHYGSLKSLAHLAKSENAVVQKLALATQLAVYKDIIPGYRIRPIGEVSGEKLSKEVRRLRAFEQSIVNGYKLYLQDLAMHARRGKPNATEPATSLATVAFSCACNLLLAVPHFNFRGDLLKILVDKLSTKKKDENFMRCVVTLHKLFEEDEDGNASMEVVTLLTRMTKARNYHVDEAVLNTFLHLRLLSELSTRASHDQVDKVEEEQPLKLKKKDRVHRTKKERKSLKERHAIENEMKEADAVVGHEERDKLQGESLKLVFVTYFRILKAREPKLMGAVLEGLAKYAHLINQDFFGDILEALKDLITAAEVQAKVDDEDDNDNDEDEEEEDDASRNITREALLCVITAFALLQGQDASKAASALHLDLNFFINYLYGTLLPVSMNPDIELSSRSLRLPDPSAPSTAAATLSVDSKVNVKTTTVLLLRSLSSVLLPPQAIRSVPPVRIAAFSKQILSASLHLPERSCLAMMGLMNKVIKTHGKKINQLWSTEERKGDGVWDATKDIQGSNPFAGNVWEGEILKNHFCPAVRENMKVMEKDLRNINR